MARRPPPRPVRRTLLLVGEGLAEEAFLRHLKAVYVERGSKAVTVRNAKGKGGGHVLDYTVRQCRAADFDEAAALLDTDHDWGEARRAQARRAGIAIFEAAPCLEALLLTIAGHHPPNATAACKRDFAQRFGHEAHAAALYPLHFAARVLDAARQRVPVLDALIHQLTR